MCLGTDAFLVHSFFLHTTSVIIQNINNKNVLQIFPNSLPFWKDRILFFFGQILCYEGFILVTVRVVSSAFHTGFRWGADFWRLVKTLYVKMEDGLSYLPQETKYSLPTILRRTWGTNWIFTHLGYCLWKYCSVFQKHCFDTDILFCLLLAESVLISFAPRSPTYVLSFCYTFFLLPHWQTRDAHIGNAQVCLYDFQTRSFQRHENPSWVHFILWIFKR